ncbi:MAG: aminotransferase class V-fold PLP-dependent enzyme [Bacillota bacterium]
MGIDLSVVRFQIPALARCIYLNTAGMGPEPRCVMAETNAWVEWENHMGPASPEVAAERRFLMREVRCALAQLIGAQEDEIALTHNVTDGINVVAWSVDWKPGDEVILTDQEHPGNLLTWYNLRDRYGTKVHLVPAGPGVNLAEEVARVLSPRTRLVSISHVSRRTGTEFPVGEVCRVAHKVGAKVLIDGAQAVGVVPVDVRDIGCDYYTLSGHKWLLGPKGTGALYVRRELLDETWPSWVGSHSEAYWDFQGTYHWLESAARFEYGTQNAGVLAGLRQAIRWLEDISWDVIRARVQTLAELIASNLASVEQVTLIPRVGRSGIVSFKLATNRIDNRRLCERLWNDHKILVSPLEHTTTDVRVAVHFFNTEEECAAVAEAVRSVLSAY